VARGQHPHLAGAELRRHRADDAVGADHARPLRRGLVRLRRQRPRRPQPVRPPQAPGAALRARVDAAAADGGGRQLPQRPARRRRQGADHLHDRHAHPTPAAPDFRPDVVDRPDVKPDPQPDPQPTPKPDLVITELGWNETSQWYFTVKNQGAAAAGAFSVEVTGEGTFSIPGLEPGASATRTFQTICKNKTYEAIADPLSQLAESDETNNRRTYENICIT
jgi:hypothetical protein